MKESGTPFLPPSIHVVIYTHPWSSYMGTSLGPKYILYSWVLADYQLSMTKCLDLFEHRCRNQTNLGRSRGREVCMLDLLRGFWVCKVGYMHSWLPQTPRTMCRDYVYAHVLNTHSSIKSLYDKDYIHQP